MGNCLFILKSSCIRCIGLVIDGVNFPLMCRFRNALIWAVLVFICPSNNLIWSDVLMILYAKERIFWQYIRVLPDSLCYPLCHLERKLCL